MHIGHRPAPDDTIDLGDEPPLLIDGGAAVFDRRALSLRWLAGTVLTGLTSAFLMGGALFVALDGRHTLAATPAEFIGPTGKPIEPIARVAGPNGVLAKADRLRMANEQFATRQVLNLSTMTRIGDKDMVRVRPFVRVNASLSLKKTDTQANIPPFNPLKVFADTDILPGRRVSTAKNPAFYDAMVEGEVALRTRDLPQDTAQFDTDIAMGSGEVERIVRDQARFLSDGSVQIAALPVSQDGRYEFKLGQPGLNSIMALRIVPENVSFYAKSDAEKAGQQQQLGLDEKIVTVDQRDSLRSILRDNAADDKMIGEITRALQKSFDLKQVEPGMRVRIGLAKIDDTGKPKPVRISIYNQTTHIGTVALDDIGSFVGAEEPGINDAVAAEDDDETNDGDTPTLYYSLYQTALDNQVPTRLIRDLVQIYSYDLDFNQRVKQGDSFEVFYSMGDDNDPNAPQEILYAGVNVKGQFKRYYRYRSPDDGTVDYYDEAGRSAKKFLVRKPMDGGILRSGFGGRRHPILGYYRMHTGVDWAYPHGTPVLASGNGTVESAGWKGGYGRYVRLQHNNGYETGYGHLSGFAKGIAPGVKVRQGQVIGYVGSTGMSTGPHLHYEVLINQAYVDPLRVKLPRGKELGGTMLADFRKERERIDALISKSTTPSKVAGTN